MQMSILSATSNVPFEELLPHARDAFKHQYGGFFGNVSNCLWNNFTKICYFYERWLPLVIGGSSSCILITIHVNVTKYTGLVVGFQLCHDCDWPAKSACYIIFKYFNDQTNFIPHMGPEATCTFKCFVLCPHFFSRWFLHHHPRLFSGLAVGVWKIILHTSL